MGECEMEISGRWVVNDWFGLIDDLLRECLHNRVNRWAAVRLRDEGLRMHHVDGLGGDA